MSRNIKTPFFKPSLGPEEYKNLKKTLKSGWLTTGHFTLELEKRFAEISGARYALACSSGTAGLHLSLSALQIPKDSFVVTSPYTFTATAEVIRHIDSHPLFADIDPKTLNIRPDAVDAAIKKNRGRTKAIIPVHVAGLPCKMEEISGTAERFGLSVVEDAAHSFPTYCKGKMIGRWGKTGVYSFYANKTITSGEGGMVLCDDSDIAEKMKIMRNHGIDRTSWDRYTSLKASHIYDVVAPGFKYNMPDIAAGIGLAQLKKAEEFKKKRKAAANYYLDKFSGLDFLTLPERGEDHAWHLFIIRIKPEKLTIDRDRFIQELRNKEIGCSLHYIPLHLMTYYKNKYDLKPGDFPESLAAYQTAVSLPLYPSIKRSQLRFVADVVSSIGKKYYNSKLCRGL